MSKIINFLKNILKNKEKIIFIVIVIIMVWLVWLFFCGVADIIEENKKAVKNYNATFLFETNGMSIYRFYDIDSYHYFTIQK